MPVIEIDTNPKTIIFSAIIIIIAFIILFIIRRFLKKLFNRSRSKGLDRKSFKKKWDEVEKIFDHKTDHSYKLAILEADKLLDLALKSMMMPGKDLGERLKAACYKYPNIRQVWAAHIVRNKIAHETDYHVSKGMANKALRQFKKAFTELGIL